MADDQETKASAEDQSSAVRASRRNFLKFSASGAAAAAVASWIPGRMASAEESKTITDESSPGQGERRIKLIVNGQEHSLNVPVNAVLLDVLRERLNLTGTKKGCDLGQCGACTLLVNDVAINSCLSLAVQHDGERITTLEGLARNGELHPVQQAFLEEDAYQCGYCTPGQIMSAVALLNDPNLPKDDASVREAMSGNICRCAAYKNILAAVQSARSSMGGLI